MAVLRIAEAAELLGVSDDTVRRWAEAGRLRDDATHSGRQVVDGAVLAGGGAASWPSRASAGDRRRRSRPATGSSGWSPGSSATRVMAQVEIQAGPHRVVSLMSREAADELGLEPGVARHRRREVHQRRRRAPGGPLMRPSRRHRPSLPLAWRCGLPRRRCGGVGRAAAAGGRVRGASSHAARSPSSPPPR